MATVIVDLEWPLEVILTFLALVFKLCAYLALMKLSTNTVSYAFLWHWMSRSVMVIQCKGKKLNLKSTKTVTFVIQIGNLNFLWLFMRDDIRKQYVPSRPAISQPQLSCFPSWGRLSSQIKSAVTVSVYQSDCGCMLFHVASYRCGEKFMEKKRCEPIFSGLKSDFYSGRWKRFHFCLTLRSKSRQMQRAQHGEERTASAQRTERQACMDKNACETVSITCMRIVYGDLGASTGKMDVW